MTTVAKSNADLLGAPSRQAAAIYVVDNDPAHRRALRQMAEAVQLEIVGFSSAEELLASLDAHSAGCIVTEMCLPGCTALQLMQRLREARIHLPVVVVTGRPDVAAAVSCMRAGAADYLIKPVTDGVLLPAMLAAIEANRQERDRLERSRLIAERLASLSPRERQIAHLVVDGRANKQIAFELGICIKTVEFHRARLMEKLHVQNLAELVRLVVLHGTPKQA
jgi:FixJ family two-component response regulator